MPFKATNGPRPPPHLSRSAKAWWRAVTEGWSGLEEHHVRLLTMAGEAWDRVQQARQVIAAEGITYRDRLGNPRRHPAVAVEIESRASFARLVRQLDLDESEPGMPRNQWRRPKPKG